jgi:hypothetical protein
VLDAARRAAEDALLDRTFLTVSPKAYAEFLARLDAPPEPNGAATENSADSSSLGVKVALSAPEPIAPTTRLGILPLVLFPSTTGSNARACQASGAARTFVVCEADKVIGYYALACGSVTVVAAPGRSGAICPSRPPVVVLAPLAVDRAYHGRSLGRAPVRDAARRVVHAADAIGIRGIVVHAI